MAMSCGYGAYLGILTQPDVVALERVRHGTPVRLLAVAEEEAGRHLLAHPISSDLIELESIAVTLS